MVEILFCSVTNVRDIKQACHSSPGAQTTNLFNDVIKLYYSKIERLSLPITSIVVFFIARVGAYPQSGVQLGPSLGQDANIRVGCENTLAYHTITAIFDNEDPGAYLSEASFRCSILR
jgi:hypothetical protein